VDITKQGKLSVRDIAHVSHVSLSQRERGLNDISLALWEGRGEGDMGMGDSKIT
jgi:hypothetical protein